MSVLKTVISARQAREVARRLKHRGYQRATISLCKGQTVEGLARHLEPTRQSFIEGLQQEILIAAGLHPGREGSSFQE